MAQHDEITQRDIENTVNSRYPDLRPFLDRVTEALYSALWVGDLFPVLAGFDSAAGKWLSENELQTAVADAELLDQAASLFLFAYDDAWFEAKIAGAGHEVQHLDRVPRCKKCSGFIDVDCLCESVGKMEVLADG